MERGRCRDAVGIRREREVAGVTLEGGGLSPRTILRAGARPESRFAQRRCIPPDTDVAEIVWVDGEEVVLVRPELLSSQRSGR